MAEYGWTPGEVDNLYIGELVKAQAVMAYRKRLEMVAMINAVRVATQADSNEFRRIVDSI